VVYNKPPHTSFFLGHGLENPKRPDDDRHVTDAGVFPE
jgi:hypothetical protein